MKLQISDNVKILVSTNERLTSELTVVKNVNNILENRIVNLEKQLSKNEQYGHRNNVEISGISNQIPDQDLEENIKIVKTWLSIYQVWISKVVIDFLLEETKPAQRNELL